MSGEGRTWKHDSLHGSIRGLGIGTTPSALMAHGINTTVVELDPVVYKFAANHFNFPPPHNLVIEDAVAFVQRSNAAEGDRRTYDYIVHDVFTGGAEPINLFTQEFLQGLSEMLTADGVIAIVNPWEGPRYVGVLANSIRITLGIFFNRPLASLFVPSNQSFQTVDSSVKTPALPHPPVMRMKPHSKILPIWLSSAAKHTTASPSESQSKPTFSAPMPENTISGLSTKSTSPALTVARATRDRRSLRETLPKRCKSIKDKAPLITGGL